MSTSSDSIRVVGEKDLLKLARVPRGTWNGWIRQEHFEGNDSGLYGEREVISVAVFNIVTDALSVREAAIAWRDCGSAVVNSCIQLPLDGEEPLVLVIDAHALDGAAAASPEELFDAVHSLVPSARGRIAIPIAALAREARRGFWKRARAASDLAQDKRRKVTQGTAKKAL
jgi:hypothetical protein